MHASSDPMLQEPSDDYVPLGTPLGTRTPLKDGAVKDYASTSGAGKNPAVGQVLLDLLNKSSLTSPRPKTRAPSSVELNDPLANPEEDREIGRQRRPVEQLRLLGRTGGAHNRSSGRWNIKKVGGSKRDLYFQDW